MNAACAAGAVRFVLTKFCGANPRVKAAIKKYKCLFSSSCLQEGSEFIGWWSIIPKQTTARDVLIEEVGGVAMAILDPSGQIAGGMGGVAEVAHGVHGNMQDVNQVREMATGEFAGAMTDRFSRAWSAGFYSSIQDTNLEFSCTLRQMILCGAIHMNVGRETVTGSIRVFHDANHLIRLMGYGENHGNVTYCKEIATTSDSTHFVF